MKKKGLIISTVVMAVVLIASLTTATYAWFSADAKTSVDQMTIKVNAASDVEIGIKTTSSTASDNDYINGTVNVGGKANPTESGNGLGTQLTVQFGSSSEITLSKACATANSSTSSAVLTSGASGYVFNPSGNSIITANSTINSGANQTTNDTGFEPSTVAAAVANTDYIYLDMGARAAKTNITAINCTISITTKDGAANLKDNAALHFYIVNGSKIQEIDVFGTYSNGTKKSTVSGTQSISGALVNQIKYSYDSTSKEVTAEFTFNVATASSGVLGSTSFDNITNFQIYAYIFGPDSDCTSAGTGTNVNFDMSFNATKTA